MKLKKYVLALFLFNTYLFLYSQSPIDKFLKCLEIAAKDSSLSDKKPVVIGVFNDSLNTITNVNWEAINSKFRLMSKEDIFFENIKGAYNIESFVTNSDSGTLVLRKRIISGDKNVNRFAKVIFRVKYNDYEVEIEEGLVIENR